MYKIKEFLFKKGALFLIVLFGLTPLFWFKGNLLIAGGDFPIPLNPTGNFMKSFFYMWYPYLYGGETNPHQFAILPWFGFWSLLKSIGFSLLTINKLWFIFVFSFSGLSMYYLVNVVFGKKTNPIFLLVAPLFYMFNVYVMVVTPVMATPLLYGFLPLVLGLYIRGLNRNGSSTKDAVLVTLSTLLLCSAMGNPPIYAILGIVLLSYYLFYILTHSKKDIVFGLIFTLKIGILYLLLNLWWLYPFVTNVLFHSKDIAKVVADSGFGGSLLSDNFRLLGSWAFYSGSGGAPYFPFAYYYKTPILIVLTFLIPLMAFASAFFKPKGKILYFLIMAALGILLANGSGSAAPINKLLFHLPGFWIFREPFAKFTAMTAISFAALIGFSTSKIYDFIQSRWNLSLARIYVLIVVLVILASSWPILTGDLTFPDRGSMKSYHVKIPDYWFETGKWFNNQKGDFRILVLPENPPCFYSGLVYKWGYGSADVTPYLVHQPLIEENAGLGSSYGKLSTNLTKAIYNKIRNFEEGNLDIKTLAQVLNVKYILQRNDVDWELISTENSLFFSPDYLRKALFSEKYFSLEKSLGDLDFYKISDESFLPHLYIPQKIVYLNGGIQSLADIVSFEDWKARSAIFLGYKDAENTDGKTDNTNRNAENWDKNIKETEEMWRTLMGRADEVFVEAKLENLAEEKHFEKLESLKNSVPFPYAKHKPGSFFYPLVLKKEQFGEWKVRKNPEKLINKKLFYAGKRIAEIEKFTDDEGGVLAMQIGKKYQLKMEEAIEEIKRFRDLDNLEDMVIKLRAYWEKHKEKIEEIEKLKPLEKIFESLDKKISYLEEKLDLQNLNYTFETPKEGNYSLLMEADELEEIGPIIVEIDGEKIATSAAKLRNDGWIVFGERNFDQGLHKLSLHLAEVKNLVGNNWQELEKIRKKEEGIQFFSQGFFPEAQNVVFQKIEDWQPGNLYYLSLDYQTEGGSLEVGVLEERKIIGDSQEVVKTEKTLNKTLKSGGLKKFETFLKADNQTLGAKIYFYALAYPNQPTRAEFKNLKIQKIIQPKIVLRSTKLQASNLKLQMPKLTFVKINPTKYRVKVEEAKTPYTLVFSESFHQGWKAYIQTSNIKHQAYGDEVASYFDGEIKEGMRGNIFLGRNTFETLGEKSIPKERHLLVNGYANSWYITSQDSKGVEDYEIIIEFLPQRWFYLGLGISTLTLAGCLGYLGCSFARKRVVPGNEKDL